MVKCNYCGEDAITHTYKQWEEHDRQWEEDVEDSDAFQQTGNYHTRSAESVEEFREGKREIYRYKLMKIIRFVRKALGLSYEKEIPTRLGWVFSYNNE